MGAPKQRWSEEEEEALKNGIQKHGAGKWTTILKDAEFRSILHARSNVDLKDKYRNMCTIRSGEGSRERAMIALKRVKLSPVRDNSPRALASVNEDFSDDIIDVKPLAMSTGYPDLSGHNKSKPKMEALILEAITNLKEHKGSNITTISMYIEERHENLSDFKQVLAETIKKMVESGKLNKVKHKYKIPQNLDIPKIKDPKVLQIEGKQKESPKAENADVKNVNKPQIDAVTTRTKGMTSEEAAKEAAQALADADVMMAEVEEAVRELEAAEAYAAASQTFLEMLSMEMAHRNISTM